MKILFLHPNTPDYLSSGLFHGLRTLMGKNCVDLPRFDCMYKPFTEGMRAKIRGRGFTLYGLLDDIPDLAEERFFIWETSLDSFDYYIISDIWRQWDDYSRLRQRVDPAKIIIIDPSDTQRVFPWNNIFKEGRHFFRSFSFVFQKAAFYFKREWSTDKNSLGALKLLPAFIRKRLLPNRMFPISFSIPSEKINSHDEDERHQLFASNIVDEEVAKNVQGSFYIPVGIQQYQFENEEAYYADIHRSKFGVTTKRSGWDCLRHYEIAANGAIICFKGLNLKAETNAPFGLNNSNCIIYEDFKDLMDQISRLSEKQYMELRANSLQWIRSYSTKAVATRFLETLSNENASKI